MSHVRTKPYPHLSLGILGGGQLARMLALKSFPMGIQTHILSEKSLDPAAQVTRHWHLGSLEKESDIRAFLAEVDIVTFESEFIDANMLKGLVRDTGTQIYPAPAIMAEIQDRLSQKNLLKKYKLPTADFLEVNSLRELRDAFLRLGPLVLKKRRNGYDGYGTYVIKSDADITPLEKIIRDEKTGFIAEKFVKFKRELACVLVRSNDGSFAELPLVESFQENSKCLWVKGPIKHPKFKSLLKQLKTFMQKIGYAGAMGFEFFDTADGILINELAPRVHNTGHYSLDTLSEDQFSLHIKAVLGEALSSPTLLRPGFAMINLLGTKNETAHWLELPTGAHLHWYGKLENRKGRKMGHINVLASSPDAALKLALKARKNFDL